MPGGSVRTHRPGAWCGPSPFRTCEYGAASSSTEDHLLMAGSIGRNTAVSGVSDVDIIFDLPCDVKKRMDGHEGNGKSDLLQEVKKIIKERYPNTTVRGDGQVVSVQFTKYTVLLIDTLVCNYFEQRDSSWTFRFEDFPDVLEDFFSYLANEDRGKAYWCALGSKQHIDNKDGGAFVPKAKKAAEKIAHAEDEELESVFTELFGKRFS